MRTAEDIQYSMRLKGFFVFDSRESIGSPSIDYVGHSVNTKQGCSPHALAKKKTYKYIWKCVSIPVEV
jgi:hypothetical protein